MKLTVILLAAALACQAQAVKKSAAPAKALRTPDGQPDLQGIWAYATVTPLERPTELAGKEALTEKEAAEFEQTVVNRNNADRRDGGAEADVGRAYNNFWYDRGTKVIKTRRTSLIIDPPDGRVPALTPTAQKRADDRAAYLKLHPSDGPEDRRLSERCIIWGTAGPPMLPSAYNNNFQIVQTPGYVVIFNEMIHDLRTIPLDKRPHIAGDIREWMGDSRGHWEGNTLVVETTNFNDKVAFRGASQNMHLVEKFTRTDPDTLTYEFTVNDPESFTKPWTAQMTASRTDAALYEYACHEGNYGMDGILAGARADEKKAK
jgi:hypothetical protein